MRGCAGLRGAGPEPESGAGCGAAARRSAVPGGAGRQSPARALFLLFPFFFSSPHFPPLPTYLFLHRISSSFPLFYFSK